MSRLAFSQPSICFILILIQAIAVRAELWPARDRGGAWGYIDDSGRFMIKAQYQDAAYFVDGVGCVMQRAIWGCIDRGGAVVVPFTLGIRSEPVFSAGLAAVGLHTPEGYRWGYIDLNGTIRIQPRFLSASIFHSGVAAVRSKDGWKFIDARGEDVFGKTFELARPFSDGLACVRIAGRYGYIDLSGRLVIKPSFLDARDFSQGLAAVATQHRSWGFIDIYGNIVIPTTFQEAFDFAHGLAPVKINWRWGYINSFGKLRVKPVFQSARAFSHGFARVRQSDLDGYIDLTGRIVIPTQFASAGDFGVSGRALVWFSASSQVTDAYHQAYIDTSGKVLWRSDQN